MFASLRIPSPYIPWNAPVLTDVLQFPDNDPLFDKPTPSGPFMSFFIKGNPLVETVIPQIRNLGDAFGSSNHPHTSIA